MYLFIFFHHIRYNFVCKQAFLFPKDKNAKLFPGISRIPGGSRYLVLPIDILPLDKRISGKRAAIQILSVHINSIYLVSLIGIVIVYTLVGITARSIYGYLIFVRCNLTAAPLLIHRAKYMEKLAHTLSL